MLNGFINLLPLFNHCSSHRVTPSLIFPHFQALPTKLTNLVHTPLQLQHHR